MVLLLAFLLVLVFFGLGFALHFLWIVAVVLLVLWLVGFALGRQARAQDLTAFIGGEGQAQADSPNGECPDRCPAYRTIQERRVMTGYVVR